MNNNMERLFEKAQLSMCEQPTIMDEYAKAIVKECARICEDLKFSPEGPTPEAKYQRVLCATAIRQHFGVNE